MPTTTRPTRAKQVIDAIGSPYLELVQGKGYWYFVFDDPARGLYETKSVMVDRLYKLSLAVWIEEGQALIDQMEARYADQQEGLYTIEIPGTPGRVTRGDKVEYMSADETLIPKRYAIRNEVSDAAAFLWDLGASWSLLTGMSGFMLSRMRKDLSAPDIVRDAILRMSPMYSGYGSRDEQLLAYAKQANPSFPLPPRVVHRAELAKEPAADAVATLTVLGVDVARAYIRESTGEPLRAGNRYIEVDTKAGTWAGCVYPYPAAVSFETPEEAFAWLDAKNPITEAAMGYLSRVRMIGPFRSAPESEAVTELEWDIAYPRGLTHILTNPPHPDVADAAWFLLDRTTYGGSTEFAARILRDTTSAGIINDARRHGFNPEGDRKQFAGRVAPWELIDAAKAVTEAGSPYDQAHAIDRLRAALKDL